MRKVFIGALFISAITSASAYEIGQVVIRKSLFGPFMDVIIDKTIQKGEVKYHFQNDINEREKELQGVNYEGEVEGLKAGSVRLDEEKSAVVVVVALTDKGKILARSPSGLYLTSPAKLLESSQSTEDSKYKLGDLVKLAATVNREERIVTGKVIAISPKSGKLLIQHGSGVSTENEIEGTYNKLLEANKIANSLEDLDGFKPNGTVIIKNDRKPRVYKINLVFSDNTVFLENGKWYSKDELSIVTIGGN